ncbi:MAG TPA: LysM peptidoglycan-binding domain-containing protein [bacterium]|nr:LysM peptidoglycan-binding domain-containing protein [bacterium]
MNNAKWLLVAVLTMGLIDAGCAGKRRIEGDEVPTQPQTDVVMPPQPMEAPPAPEVAEEPPAPEPTATPAPAPPPPPVAEEPAATPEPTQAPKKEIEKYIVVKGDTLWDISGMRIIYKDNFDWPLLFKANRDQITDPDLIYPKQELLIRRDWTQEDLDKAKKDASDTPKYVPHTKPRETLPVNYF